MDDYDSPCGRPGVRRRGSNCGKHVATLAKHKGCKRKKHDYRHTSTVGGTETNPISWKYDLFWHTKIYICNKCGDKQQETEYRRRFSIQWWPDKYKALVTAPNEYE